MHWKAEANVEKRSHHKSRGPQLRLGGIPCCEGGRELEIDARSHGGWRKRVWVIDGMAFITFTSLGNKLVETKRLNLCIIQVVSFVFHFDTFDIASEREKTTTTTTKFFHYDRPFLAVFVHTLVLTIVCILLQLRV